MDIRLFEESDEAAVADLWRKVFPDPFDQESPEMDIRRKLAIQRDLFFVAMIDGVVVATALAGYDGYRGWVYSVAVTPACRRQGIGTALMSRVESEMSQRGCPRLKLQVRVPDDSTVAFFRRLGYRVEARVSMSKKLS